MEIWTGETKGKKLPALDNEDEQIQLSYPQVQDMASQARKTMGLGDRPGESLLRILEEIFSVKIFHLDIGSAGCAACAKSEEFGEAILLNKKCSRWRRNHDLAHELFHLLTWNRFRRAEGICEPEDQEDKFATCFAGNLLLPIGEVSTAISTLCQLLISSSL